MPLSTALSQLEALCTELSDEVPVGLVLPQEEQGDERECVVCMVAPRAARYRCGHCVACEACTLQLERCPSCRVAPIEVVARGATLAFEESFVATPR